MKPRPNLFPYLGKGLIELQQNVNEIELNTKGFFALWLNRTTVECKSDSHFPGGGNGNGLIELQQNVNFFIVSESSLAFYRLNRTTVECKYRIVDVADVMVAQA